MSLTSVRGYFTLGNISVSDNIFAGRGVFPKIVSVTPSIKNNDTATIRYCGIAFDWYYRSTNGDANLVSAGRWLHGNEGASGSDSLLDSAWNPSAYKNFPGSITFNVNSSYPMNTSPTVDGTLQVSTLKGYGIAITIVYQRQMTSTTSVLQRDYIYLTQEETDKYIPMWLTPFSPSIQFNAVRCDANGSPNDEGNHVLVAVKLNTRGKFNISQMISAGYKSSPTVTLDGSYVSHTLTLQKCYNGVFEYTIVSGEEVGITKPTAIPAEVSASSDHTLLIRFADAYEPCEMPVEISRAFANLHLSEYSKGGACFGGFSKSNAQNGPLLESYYPIVAYAGITDARDTLQYLAFEGSKFKAYSGDSNAPLYPVLRTHHMLATLQGVITPSSAISGRTAQHVICKIPSAYAPEYITASLQQGTGTAIWLLRIYPDNYTDTDGTDRSCQVTFSRYRKGESYAEAAAGDWLPFYATWVIA